MKKNAFTLAEILITLGIIGVMMALAVSIIKPREIHYKYQYQQAQRTLSEAMREAVLRTNYTDHRFPKQTYDSMKPILQLCKGLNETLNTTKQTENVALETSSIDGKSGVCTITTLTGMKFYLYAPGANGTPVCRKHDIYEKDKDGNIVMKNGAPNKLATVPVASFVAFVDIDGKGNYYSVSKKHPSGANTTTSMGNLLAFWLDEDYQARPISVGTNVNSITTVASSCGF